MRRLNATSLLAGLASALWAASAGAGSVTYPKPDRPVAEIISPIWASEAERDKVDEVGQVARGLRIGAGTRVADIGAGSGYYTTRLARLVGSDGHVFAEDVVPSYLKSLEQRLKRKKLDNVSVIAGRPDDAKIPTASIDAAILVHMYHEIEQPFGLLARLAPAFRAGGRLGIVDLDRETELHGTPRDLLRCEVESVGYRQVGFEMLTGNVGYLATFEPPTDGTPVEPGAIRRCSAKR